MPVLNMRNKDIGMEKIREHIENKIIHTPVNNDFLKQLQKYKVVFTNGCFDVLHYGHIAYLVQARLLGDLLIVGLNDDDSVRRLKGMSRPVNPLYARAYSLAALEMVDFVIPFDEDTPYNLITAVKPNILVKGGDYTENNIAGADFVRKNGGEIHIIPLIDNFSTTAILKKLAKR